MIAASNQKKMGTIYCHFFPLCRLLLGTINQVVVRVYIFPFFPIRVGFFSEKSIDTHLLKSSIRDQEEEGEKSYLTQFCRNTQSLVNAEWDLQQLVLLVTSQILQKPPCKQRYVRTIKVITFFCVGIGSIKCYGGSTDHQPAFFTAFFFRATFFSEGCFCFFSCFRFKSSDEKWLLIVGSHDGFFI